MFVVFIELNFDYTFSFNNKRSNIFKYLKPFSKPLNLKSTSH